jgi:hypothetical protein
VQVANIDDQQLPNLVFLMGPATLFSGALPPNPGSPRSSAHHTYTMPFLGKPPDIWWCSLRYSLDGGANWTTLVSSGVAPPAITYDLPLLALTTAQGIGVDDESRTGGVSSE